MLQCCLHRVSQLASSSGGVHHPTFSFGAGTRRAPYQESDRRGRNSSVHRSSSTVGPLSTESANLATVWKCLQAKGTSMNKRLDIGIGIDKANGEVTLGDGHATRCHGTARGVKLQVSGLVDYIDIIVLGECSEEQILVMSWLYRRNQAIDCAQRRM
ncbi:hypothetical protein MIR68_011147 [Amoeboaphelidium protococcarum]|nr:hypothetical protein MIR68_011147 [Amoeboaphelidium protococcarum]